jgi:hypothetical protein
METKTYLGRVLIAIDQLGNALAGGNPDATISARLGWLYMNRTTWWTTLLMRIVDITFYSLDGKNHCLQAYDKTMDEPMRRGSDIALAVLGLLIIPSCAILFLPILVYAVMTK